VIKVKDIIISDDIIYIGADDKDIELFENQYNVPNGVAYNSYIIIDKKIAINNRYN
jgi:flavorubredoxin